MKKYVTSKIVTKANKKIMNGHKPKIHYVTYVIIEKANNKIMERG